MIFTKEDLITYLKADAIANERKTIKPKFFGDEIWKIFKTADMRNFFMIMMGLLAMASCKNEIKDKEVDPCEDHSKRVYTDKRFKFISKNIYAHELLP